jgi:ATP-dependent exoDNAse (exonuclease V) beta subunit
VAITRAVHALHIIVDSKTKADSLKSSGFVLNGLAESALEPESLVCELGDEHWYSKETEKFAQRQVSGMTAELPPAEPIKLAPSAGRKKRNLELVTPSQHGGAAISMTELLQSESSIQRARGSLIHAWFEQIAWLEEGIPGDERLLKIGGQFARPGLNVSEELRWFRNRLDSDELQRELSLERYRTEVAPELFPELATELAEGQIDLETGLERRIVYRTESELVNGIVDRLILYRREGEVVAADVIDYKTDSAPDEPAIQTLEAQYRPQLTLYGQAMRKLYQLDESQVVTRLGFVSVPAFRRV